MRPLPRTDHVTASSPGAASDSPVRRLVAASAQLVPLLDPVAAWFTYTMPVSRSRIAVNAALTSAVKRVSPLVVAWTLSSVALLRPGFLVTWLMTPPVEPRPNSIEERGRTGNSRVMLSLHEDLTLQV